MKRAALGLTLWLAGGAAWAGENWVPVTTSTFSAPGQAAATWQVYVDNNSFHLLKIRGTPDQTLVVWNEMHQNIQSQAIDFGSEAANCDRIGILYPAVPENNRITTAPMTTRPGTTGFAIWTHACNWYKKQPSANRFFGK